jgi:hypothetical protein
MGRAATGAGAGNALIGALVILVSLAGFAVAALTLTMAHKREVTSVSEQSRAFYMAEAGVSRCVLTLTAAAVTGDAVPGSIGSAGAPIALKDGAYWCSLTPNADGSYAVRSTGTADRKLATLEAIVAPNAGGVWDHAIFAGNSEDDPTYALELGGSGAQADDVDGNIYSGNDIEISGDATVSGDVHACGTITGIGGDEGKKHSVPDSAGMDYATNHDFDVAAMFAADGFSSSSGLGGTALQLPEDSPAHIFRLNPNDRLTEIGGTAKDDYFLEDPYEAVTDFTSPGGMSGHTITLSGAPGELGPAGTDKVYYIDGNLWVHNKPFGSMRFKDGGPDGAKLTFIVKGNIYFSDDVLLIDPVKDGVAFIAIKDELEANSGNIYLGDPRYGTLDTMHSYMYAENNFYDNNLDASGSKKVTLFGNMTAGNQVDIQRDFDDGSGTVEHSKLTVNFDNRLSTGALTLPGLPGLGTGSTSFSVVFWREIADL